MTTVRALRGVCIGINRHLLPGDVDQVDAATANYLVNIKAVELVPEGQDQPETKTKPPAAAGKKE